MNSKKQIYSLDSLPDIAGAMNKLIHDEQIRIVTLEGSIGAGKTSLVRTMLQKMGVVVPVSSPTFSYINIYTLPSGKKVYHFDLYRLSRLQQFYDAGFDEYIEDDQALILIEWPALIENELRGTICKVVLEYISAEQREIIYTNKVQ